MNADKKREITVSVDLRVSTHYKTCANCRLLIPKTQKKCPLCGGKEFNKYLYVLRKPDEFDPIHSHLQRRTTPNYATTEGTGRSCHGAACDIFARTVTGRPIGARCSIKFLR